MYVFSNLICMNNLNSPRYQQSRGNARSCYHGNDGSFTDFTSLSTGGAVALPVPHPCLNSPRDFWNPHWKGDIAGVKCEFRNNSYRYFHFRPIAASHAGEGVA